MMANLVAIGGLVGVIASVSLLALQTRTLVEQTKISNAIASATVMNEMMQRNPDWWPELREAVIQNSRL